MGNGEEDETPSVCCAATSPGSPVEAKEVALFTVGESEITLL